jgi:hypothetical protein
MAKADRRTAKNVVSVRRFWVQRFRVQRFWVQRFWVQRL